MKYLYVISKEDNKVVFYISKVFEETETEYITSTDFNWLIKGAGWNFPKDKINKRLSKGFVTNRFNSKKIREQVEKMYKELDEKYNDYIRQYTLNKEANYFSYKQSLKKVEDLKENRSKDFCIL